MLVKNLENSENNAFSVEYSEAMVRDIDMNPCALESWGLALSNARELMAIQCTHSPLKLNDWSL